MTLLALAAGAKRLGNLPSTSSSPELLLPAPSATLLGAGCGAVFSSAAFRGIRSEPLRLQPTHTAAFYAS